MSHVTKQILQCAASIETAGALPAAEQRAALMQSAAQLRRASVLVDVVLRAAAKSLFAHHHTDIPAAERRMADKGLRRALRRAHKESAT